MPEDRGQLESTGTSSNSIRHFAWKICDVITVVEGWNYPQCLIIRYQNPTGSPKINLAVS